MRAFRTGQELERSPRLGARQEAEGGSPEMHIGQLEEALLQNVRFVVAIGFHRQGMTPAEAEKLFRDKAHRDEATAEQQARRETFDPEFLNYTLGKLMIRKLRDDWCATRGGRSAWKAFHDQFLSYGAPAIPFGSSSDAGRR